MILLAFRMTKHYWRLALRQLTLPVGLHGESFPYRSEFVDESVGPETHAEGLICGKIDIEDHYSDADQRSAYIPLRLVWDVKPQFVPDSNVKYFNYTLGLSVDYRGDRGWNHYSEAIRAAVLDSMRHRSDHLQVDSDKVLVIRIDYRFPELNPDEELDRWIRLTRLVAGEDMYRGLSNNFEISQRYKAVAYGRIASVQDLGWTGRQSLIQDGRIWIGAGKEFSVNLVTNVNPDVADLKPFSYRLSASKVYFEVIDDITEVSQGILNHRFLARCRKVFGGRTHVRMHAPGVSGVYAPEIVLPIKVSASIWLWPRVLGAILIFLGLVVGYIGILPDEDLVRIVSTLTFLSTDLGHTRFMLRFAAITAASGGIGLSLFSQDRPS